MSEGNSDKVQTCMPNKATLAALGTYLSHFDNRLHHKTRYAILDPEEDARQERLDNMSRRATYRKAIREREYVSDYGFTKDKTLPYVTPSGYTMFRTGRVLGDGSEADDESRVFVIQSKGLSRQWFAMRLVASLMERMHAFYGKEGCSSQATFLPKYEYDFCETGNGFVLSLDGGADAFTVKPFSFGAVEKADKADGNPIEGAMFDSFAVPIDGFREQGAFRRDRVPFPSGNGWEIATIEGTGGKYDRMRQWVGVADGAYATVSFPASKVRPRPDKDVPGGSVATLHVLWDGRAGIDAASWDRGTPWARQLGLLRNMVVAWVTVETPDGTTLNPSAHPQVTKSAIAGLAISLCVEMSLSPKATAEERRRHDAHDADARNRVPLGDGASHRCEESAKAGCAIRRRKDADAPWVLWQFGEKSGQRRGTGPNYRIFGEKPWFWPTPVNGVRLCPWCGENLK